MRSLLERMNAQMQRCTYIGMTWRGSGPIIKAIRNGSRVCAEVHNGPRLHNFWNHIVRLQRLRLTAGGCSGVRVILRVREPFAWYLSWYLWTSGYDGRKQLNASTLPANMQARIILGTDGGLAADGTPPRGGPLAPVERRALHRALRLADVVAPLERFDELALLLTRIVGGWLSPTYARMNAHKRRLRDGNGDNGATVRFARASEVCAEADPELPRCRALVRRLAADDHALYEEATRRFDAQLRRVQRADAPSTPHGQTWAAELAAHRASHCALTRHLNLPPRDIIHLARLQSAAGNRGAVQRVDADPRYNPKIAAHLARCRGYP